MECKHAYFAGFFDGEGCIQIARYPGHRGKRCHRLCVGLYNCNRAVLEEAQRLYGGWLGERGRLARVGKNWRIHFELHLYSNKAADALRLWLPLLIVKKDEAELALKFQATRRLPGHRRWTPLTERDASKAESFREEMKQLKHRVLG